MGESRFVVSLRFWHPSIDPSVITTALGRQPKRAWKMGEPRIDHRGMALPGVYDQSYWTSGYIIEGRDPPESLTKEIERLADDLLPHRNFFEKIRTEGGGCNFLVGYWLGGNAGEVFPAALLGKMASLGIDLDFDIYHDEGLEAADDKE